MTLPYYIPSTSRLFSGRTSQESTPSLTSSDFGSDEIEDTMAYASIKKEDVSAIMQKVLEHLHGVCEHLRDRNQNDAANEIAKQTYSMVETFNNATAAWDFEAFLMEPCAPRRPAPAPVLSTANNQYQKFLANSWAAVAATPTPEGNKVVKYHPSDAVKCTVSNMPVPAVGDMRVVWIQPWDAKESLAKVTERINQGPLLSMAFSKNDDAVCIIFQHAEHALSFLEDNADCVQRYGYGLFGPHRHVLSGQPYPYDDGIKRMEPPLNERRRLTFARSQFFTGAMSERQFKKDIYALVGEENVELVWLFNSGNATVVFSATAIARMIRDEFRKRARHSGAYRDIQVTFSHDPCERPMNLITQIPQDAALRGNVEQNNGGSGSRPTGSIASRRSSNPASAPRVDRDGWTTVSRRR